MPIVNTREGNPRWGFLDGLGAAPSPVLSAEEMESFKKDLRDLIPQTDEAIYGALRSSRLTTLVEGSLPSLRQTVADRVDEYERNKKFFWDVAGSGMIDGKPVSREKAAQILRALNKYITLVQDAVQNLKQYTPARLLVGSVVDVFNSVTSGLSRVAKALLDAAEKVAKGLAGAAGGAGDTLSLLKYLPHIIVGGLVLFYVVPTVLKARREGSVGLESDLRAGRSRIESGARSAGSAAMKAGRAAALLGSPKRRRRK